MNRLLSSTLAGIVVGIAFSAPVHAATDAEKAAAKAKYDAMTPEEQAAAKAKAKSAYESMTPEEKAAAKAKAKAKWDAMTPEEQAAAKKRYAEKHRKTAAAAPAPSASAAK
jgi:hypothetical protein